MVEALYNVNVQGAKHLLDAVRQANFDSVVLIPISGAVYGIIEPDDLPVRESQPFRPPNFHAVSKIAQEMLALVGSGQPPSLVDSAFAQQIAQIEAGCIESVLHVGNLATQRDFVDVRDVVRAYRLPTELGRPSDVYNVCSGEGGSIQACLDKLLRLTEMSIQVLQDPARMCPSDVPISVGDGSHLQKQIGWHLIIPLKQSLGDLPEDWRQRIKGM